jgi:hypothetical protein
LNKGQLFLSFDNPDSASMFEPNMVILPTEEFKISIAIRTINSKDQSLPIKAYFSVNLHKFKKDLLTVQVNQENLNF